MIFSVPQPVVLDTCVLVDACLRDLLLRLAETPALYLPRWSGEIMAELERTLTDKLGVSAARWEHLHSQLGEHFAGSWVDAEFRGWIPRLTNHQKDRHVLAAAIQAEARQIVTYNLKDFAPADLAAWSVSAVSPDAFLCDCFEADPDTALGKLDLLAADSNRPLPALLDRLRRVNLHAFAALASGAC
jgi:predicted nucleic acid-binding protein